MRKFFFLFKWLFYNCRFPFLEFEPNLLTFSFRILLVDNPTLLAQLVLFIVVLTFFSVALFHLLAIDYP